MTQYHLMISSPDGTIFDDDVEQLSVRGVEGELAVMAGHVPFLTVLKAGECRVYLSDGAVRKADCGGGILSVQRDGVRLLSSDFIWKTENKK